jgi:hypothetical protein
MRKMLFFLSFLLGMPFQSSFALFKQVPGIEDVQIKRIAVSDLDPSLIYVGSQNSLYQSKDRGKTFKKVAVFKDAHVRHILFDPYLVEVLYIATTRHVYKWKDGLQEIFSVPDGEIILTLSKHKGKIYIGTSKGLRFAREDILVWGKVKGLGDPLVSYIEPVQKLIYLATSKGVYILDENDKIERVFITREAQEDDEEIDEEDQERESNLILNIIKDDIFDQNRLWMGTNQGLFASSDAGRSWTKLYIEGIDSLPILSIAQTNLEKDTLYLGTPKGFFRVNLEAKDSKQIFEGLSSSNIFWVEFTPKGIIYLATANGLFRNNYFTPSGGGRLGELLDNEPSMGEIQEAAMIYNGVDPKKIREWRNSLKYRALFPEVSLDYDKTIYGSSSGKFAVGPRDWGVSFSWDVGDLIWNTYEDDVDTRARLNTQLRIDILEEIIRVYYERLRLKREIVSGSLPEEELFKKQLRLAELTAILDGYTGGFFSARIKELNEQ